MPSSRKGSEINQTIATFNLNYELSPKYLLTAVQSFNFSESRNETSAVGIIRRFDRFLVTLQVYYDAVEDESGFRFGIVPEGLGGGFTTQGFGSLFAQ